MIALALGALVASGLPLESLDGDGSVGVVVSLAVNLDPEDLDRTAAGIELALARSTTGLFVVRVQPDVPLDCPSQPDCQAALRERFGVEALWFLIATRVGADVRFEGSVASGPAGSVRPLVPFVVPRGALEEAVGYGAPDPAPPEPPGPSEGEPRAEMAPDRPPRKIPIASWVLGGTAAGALATGIGFGVAAASTESSLEDDGCDVRACDPERVDRLETQALIADVAFGVAAAAAVAAVVVHFASPRPEAPTLGFMPLRGGGGVALGGRF